MRMCCGCNKRFEQHRLIRLQTSSETQALIPVVRKETGRSAWVCCSIECIRTIRKHPKRLYRSLRTIPRVDLFTMTLYSWILARAQRQFQQMHREGAITVAQDPTTRIEADTPYIFPTGLYNELYLDCLNLNHVQLTDDDCIQIRKHHLLQSTIHYTALLMELKLDSIA